MLLCVYGAHRVLSRALAQIIKLVRDMVNESSDSMCVCHGPVISRAWKSPVMNPDNLCTNGLFHILWGDKWHASIYTYTNSRPCRSLHVWLLKWRGKSGFLRVTLVPNWHTKLWCNLISQIFTAKTGRRHSWRILIGNGAKPGSRYPVRTTGRLLHEITSSPFSSHSSPFSRNVLPPPAKGSTLAILWDAFAFAFWLLPWKRIDVIPHWFFILYFIDYT